MNNKQYNYRSTIDDLALTISIQLNIPQGAELVSALGYPQAHSNQSAIRFWIVDHLECYQGVERQFLLSQLIYEIREQIHEHFGLNLFTAY